MEGPAKQKVLIVEDEAVLMEFLNRMLLKLGYDVAGTAATGADAVALALKQAPGIILMDIHLRGEMDGIEAARRIHESKDIPILFLTAHSDAATVERAKAASPYGYLVKPIDARALEIAMEVVIVRHGMEVELRRSNLKFRALLDASPDTILRLRRDGTLLESSVRATHITEVLAADVVVRALACIDQCLQTGRLQRMEFMSGQAPNAQWLELSAVRFDHDEVVAVIRDITQHRKALTRAVESMTMFQSYSQRLQSAREEERKSIAREIHDELGQTLIGLKMQLEASLGEKFRSRGDIESMIQAVDRAIQEVRRITAKLRPLILDDLGLAAALEWLRRDFEQRTGIRCTLSTKDEIPADSPRATAVFRIVQEALTNAARHSGASRVAIAVRQAGDELLVRVRDSGRGIKEGEASGGSGHGLIGMSERAAAFGGRVVVKGVAGRGTTVRVRIPLSGKGQGHK